MINIKVLKDFAEVSYQISGSQKKETKIVGLSEIPLLFDTKISFDSGILPLFGNENALGIQRLVQRDNYYYVLVQGINPFLNTRHVAGNVFTDKDLKNFKLNHIENTDLLISKKDDVYEYKNVYYPNLLMSLMLKKETKGTLKIEKSGILAYSDHFISEDTQLYEFPFSNTHSGSVYGQICWGGQGTPQLGSLAQSVAIMQSFLGSTMNHDLYKKAYVNGHALETSSDLLTYLSLKSSELSAFPYKDIEMKKIIKYNDLMSYLNQNWK